MFKFNFIINRYLRVYENYELTEQIDNVKLIASLANNVEVVINVVMKNKKQLHPSN